MMQNLKYVEIENEVLRSRLATIKAAAVEFAEMVARYVEPKKGDTYCSRTEILNKKEKSIYIVEPTENGKAIEIPEVKDFKKLYEDIVKSEWFKKAYHDKSLGDCPFVIDELEESEEQMICPKCGNYEYSTKKL